MEKKKLAVLIPGRLRFTKLNLDFIKSVFSNFDYHFFITAWDNETSSNISLFKEHYNPKIIEYIKPLEKEEYKESVVYHPKNETFYRDILVKPVTGTFNMFYSIQKSFENFNKFTKDKNIEYDYVCRFRPDIRLLRDTIDLNSILKKNYNKILIPDLYQNYGINDQFAIGNTKIMSKYFKIYDYLEEHINKNKFFHNEYINFCFLKKINLKIKYIKLIYEIDRETFTKSRTIRDKPIFFPKTRTKIPFEFKFDTWLLKQKYKFRNFKEIYIKKTVTKWGQPLL